MRHAPSALLIRSLLDAEGVAPRDVKVFLTHGEPLFVMDVANRYSVGAAMGGSTRHVLVDTSGRVLPGSYQGPAAQSEYRWGCANRLQSASRKQQTALPQYGAGQFEWILRNARMLGALVANVTARNGSRPVRQLRVDFFINQTHR